MNGLTTKAARERLKQDGENELAAAAKLHPLRMFLGQFRDVMVLILLAATGVSAFLGEITDAVTIILIVLLNAILGFLQEYRTEQTLESLRSLTAPTATVCRDGKWQTIPARELVCGDCIRLEAGDNVPADSALVRADGLSVNESILTGESEAVSKQSGDPADTRNDLHKKNVVYAGTAVLHGSAEAVVIATGTRTQMGQISAMLQEVKQDLTPLQKRLAGLGKVVALLCLGVCGAVFLAGVLRGEPVFDMLMTGITIAIAAIPEGLPATVTIALALAVSRMMKRNALVNRLHSVETLGCASVICSDKTGTITENRMTVTAVRVGGESFSVTGTGLQKAGAIQQDGRNVNPLSKPALKELLICGALCCTAEIHSPQESARRDRSARTDKGSWSATGDPTEVALLVAAEKGGVSRQELLRSHPVLRSEPFDSETRRMSVTVTQGAGTCTYWKGAADAILPLCGFQMRDGKTVPFSESDRAAVRRSVTELSDQALRVLAFARQEDGACVFLGLAGMLDPPRESARTAIRTCARANIRTVMITGDHKNTAAAIAKQAGLLRGKKAMTGDELDALSDAQLDACLDQYTVFARVNPAHKLRLVRAYRRRGEIVAMTGDGVNDAPAIKEADVGVAMGKSGTDVARQAADVVLTDDNLATLVDAVEQGRCVYANIRKFVRYLLSCNIGEVLTMFLGILMGMPVVLLPTQLLLVNLVTDGLPAIALGLEPPEPEAMQKPDESFFSDGLMGRIFFRGILIGICTLGAFSTVIRTGGTLEAARTAALCTLILSQLVHVFECKSERRTLFSMPYGNNLWLISAVAVSLAVLAAAVVFPMLRVIFSTVMLTRPQLYIALGFSLAVPLCSSVAGLFRRKK
jgi:Ca2+-transporting ATPase